MYRLGASGKTIIPAIYDCLQRLGAVGVGGGSSAEDEIQTVWHQGAEAISLWLHKDITGETKHRQRPYPWDLRNKYKGINKE